MKNLLWLDDLRNPYINEENRLPKGDWNINWVRNFEEFRKWIKLYGIPDAISFDHDLAPEHYTPSYFWDNYEESKKYQLWKAKTYKEQTGEGCAAWLKDYCRTNDLDLPKVFVHSANPVGADFIKNILKD